jgi:hypothetical protein
VKPRGGPTEMQFLGNGNEVGQLPEFHVVRWYSWPAVLGGAYDTLVISRGPKTNTGVNSLSGPSLCVQMTKLSSRQTRCHPYCDASESTYQ